MRAILATTTATLALAVSAPALAQDTQTADEVQQQTGFPITLPANARPETPPRITPPTPEELEMLRSRVRREVAEVYPRFAAERLGAP